MEENINKIIEEAKNKFITRDISIISQNCIGGIIYHDMGMKFLSPTINLYFEAKDFIKFISDLDFYLKTEIKMFKDENNIIIGILKDIKVIFLHYTSEEEAKEKWIERKTRIIKDKIFIISTDRDGFDELDFENFKKVKYPKVLITRNEKWKDYDFVIYLEKYKELTEVPNTIPTREFYKDNKIIELINKMN